ncbi:MAG TPA: ABC transporter permease, partial [Chthoniobacterales bacterium]|nr:ABC transporter permease [Chthoniobacterales bacterium]
MDGLWRDLRHGFRMLTKSPTFTVVAVLSLTIGIGANTAIFSVIDAMLLSSLPVKKPEQLMFIRFPSHRTPEALTYGGYRNGISYPVFDDLEERTSAIAAVFGYAPMGYEKDQIEVRIDGRFSFAEADMVSGDFFSVLGVTPIAGRTIGPADEASGSPPAAVISYGYWSRQFSRSATALGKSVLLNGVSFTIVGVAPREFFGIEPGRTPDYWIPIVDHPAFCPWVSGVVRPFPIHDVNWWWMESVARLKPGVKLEIARAQIEDSIHRSMVARLNPPPSADEFPVVVLEPLASGLPRMQSQYAKPLYLSMAVVAMVLLIACANIASLLMARASARQKEVGIRLSMGASRSRLIRQL